MRKDEFINALYSCGWNSDNDAQHKKVTELHREIFPVVASLEDDLACANEDFRQLKMLFKGLEDALAEAEDELNQRRPV
jgi:hypothetical protein